MSELVASTWALAEMRLATSSIWPSVSESLEHFRYNPRASSALLRAHAVIMVPPPPSLLKLDLRAASPQSLANSLWALAKLQLESPEDIGEVLKLLNKTLSGFKPQEFSSCIWAVASMEEVDAAFFQKLQIPSFRCFQDHHLSQVAWAFASAGVRRLDVMDTLALEILQRRGMGLQALANISWAYATLEMLESYNGLEEHLLAEAEKLLSRVSPEDVDSLLGLLWAHRSSRAAQPLLAAIQDRLRQLGKALDAREAKPRSSGSTGSTVTKNPEPPELQTGKTDLPRVVLQVPGVAILFKPRDWEVDALGDGHHKSLSGFSRAVGLGLSDRDGFISRLDTPSSGLLLQASSFEGLFVLQGQRELGALERDYIVLCLGWVPGDGDICFRLRRVGRSTVVSERGRPALSRVKVLAHLSHLGRRLSLLALRIESGRMHQIRSHLAHIGFPVCGDARYNPQWQPQAEEEWPRGHFLHRYRVAFTDLAGQRNEVTEPLPRPWASFLAKLQEHHGGANVRPWLSQSYVLQSWDVVHRSWVPSESLLAEQKECRKQEESSSPSVAGSQDPTKRLGGGPNDGEEVWSCCLARNAVRATCR